MVCVRVCVVYCYPLDLGVGLGGATRVKQDSGVGEQENNLTYAALSSIDYKLVGRHELDGEGMNERTHERGSFLPFLCSHLTQLLPLLLLPLFLLQVFLSAGRAGNDLAFV